MIYFYIDWVVIFLILVGILGLIENILGSSEVVWLARGIGYIVGWVTRLIAIGEMGSIFICWKSRRTVFIKMWNSILIAGISYCTWQASTAFLGYSKEFSGKSSSWAILSMLGFLGNLIVILHILMLSAWTVYALSNETGEKVYESVFGIISFQAMITVSWEGIFEELTANSLKLPASFVPEAKIFEKLINILNIEVLFNIHVRVLLLCVLGVSLAYTIILTVKNGFKSYNMDNIRKMWIAIGIVVASLLPFLFTGIHVHWFVSIAVIFFILMLE